MVLLTQEVMVRFVLLPISVAEVEAPLRQITSLSFVLHPQQLARHVGLYAYRYRSEVGWTLRGMRAVYI